MRTIFKKLIKLFLKKLTHIYLKEHDISIVFLCGDGQKAHIKASLLETLNNSNFPARGNYKGYNFDLGVPLSILGIQAGSASPLMWLKVLQRARKQATQMDETKIIILEIPIERKGDAAVITDIVTPDVTIINQIRENADELTEEYSCIISKTKELLVLNADRNELTQFNDAHSTVKTYGTTGEADVTALHIREENDGQKFTFKRGISSMN